MATFSVFTLLEMRHQRVSQDGLAFACAAFWCVQEQGVCPMRGPAGAGAAALSLGLCNLGVVGLGWAQ